MSAASVTSVDNIEYNSNSQFFNGKVFQISYTNNFDTDRINVFLDRSRLDGSTDGDVEQDLQIYTNHQNQKARYSIGSSGRRPLYNLELITEVKDTKSQREEWVRNNCYDVNQDGIHEYAKKPVLSWDGFDYKAYCSRINGRYGNIGDIQSPDAVFDVEWCVEASGKSPECKVISNGETGEGVIANLGSHAKVKFGGVFSTGRGTPIADDELAIHSNTIPGNWKVISESNYDDWDRYVSNTLWDRYLDWAKGDASKSLLQGEIDGKEQKAYSTFTQSPFNDAEVVDSSFDTGQLQLSMDSIGYPRSIIYVDAGEDGYIQIEKPTGDPSIVDVDGDTFGEFESGTIEATVKNVGDGEGSFSGRIKSCSENFSPDSLQRTTLLDPGESTTYSLRVSFSAGSDLPDTVEGTCNFEVKETNTGVSASETVVVTGNQANECTPGKAVIKVENGNEVIYKCSSDGQNLRVVERCEGDETAVQENGEYVCKEESKPPVLEDCESTLFGFKYSNPVCEVQNRLDNITGGITLGLFLLDIVVAILGFTAGFILGSDLIGRMSDASGVPVLSSGLVVLGASVLVGLLVATAAFTLFQSIVIKILLIVGLVGGTYIWLSLPF